MKSTEKISIILALTLTISVFFVVFVEGPTIACEDTAPCKKDNTTWTDGGPCRRDVCDRQPISGIVALLSLLLLMGVVSYDEVRN